MRLLKNVEKKPVQQVNENVSCTCAVASKGTYRELLRDVYIDMLLEAGVRMLEISCGSCCGIDQAPATEGIAVCTSNRNFKGRSGNPNAQINISTDNITPASAEFSSMRSNIPLLSRYCYHRYAPDFAARAEKMGSSIIVAGENYRQGSSREHAAINPMYLSVKCVIAKSIARIHKGNLVNHGLFLYGKA